MKTLLFIAGGAWLTWLAAHKLAENGVQIPLKDSPASLLLYPAIGGGIGFLLARKF